MIKKSKLAKARPWLALFALVSYHELHADPVTLPNEFPRQSNSNLLSVTDSAFAGSAGGWTIEFAPTGGDKPSFYSAQYDNTVNHTTDITGTGSIKFSPNTVDRFQHWTVLTSNYIAVDAGKTYTVSFYAKMDHPNSYLQVALWQYKDVGGVKERLPTDGFSTGGTVSVSTAGEWQEITAVVKATDPAATSIKIYIGSYHESAPSSLDSPFYIDDVYFGEGISFAQSPSTVRNSFPRDDLSAPGASPIDSYVKVDALGNWSVKKNNVWTPFFPFGIYAQLGRPDFSEYAAKHLNTVFNMNFFSQVQKAKNAGLYAGLRLGIYADGDNPKRWELEPMVGYDGPTLDAVLADRANYPGIDETLLCYEWDNENAWLWWTRWQQMVNMVRASDKTHPIYELQGQAGAQRTLNSLSDVTGTYVAPDVTTSNYLNEEGGIGRFEILQNQEKQTVPVSIAQINDPDDTLNGLRIKIYDALIKGARGIMLFSTGESEEIGTAKSDPIENRAWWGEVPKLSQELEDMKLMLRESAVTAWSASSSDPKVRFAMRTHRGEGYLIVLNYQDAQTTTTFTLTGFAPNTALDFLDKDRRVTGVNTLKQFTVTLPPYGTAVYHLVKEVLVNGDMEDGANWASFRTTPTASHVMLVDSLSYGGDQSVEIYNQNTTDQSHYYQFFSPLEAGKKYRFSARVQTLGVVKDSVNDYWGAIVQLYAGGQNMFPPLPNEAGLKDTIETWKLIENDFTLATPINNDWYIRLQLWKASGTVWYDNVSLRELLL